MGALRRLRKDGRWAEKQSEGSIPQGTHAAWGGTGGSRSAWVSLPAFAHLTKTTDRWNGSSDANTRSSSLNPAAQRRRGFLRSG